ncbi:MAG: hypothetical protein HY395_01685 [Candidatus Doudnabacteria bacterium]|nr:hypothetical protein [Candidatus Doudnabacteria bacterium]
MRKWRLNVTRPDYLLNQTLIGLSDIHHLDKFIGQGYSEYLAVFQNGVVSGYSPANEIEKQIKILSKDLRKAKKVLGRLQTVVVKTRREMNHLLRKIKSKRFSVSDFEQAFEAYQDLITYRVTTRILGYKKGLPTAFINQASGSRLWFKEEWLKIKEILAKLLVEVAKQHRVPVKLIKSLTVSEFYQGIRQGDFEQFRDKTSSHVEPMVLLSDKNRHQVLTGYKAKAYLSRYLYEKVEAKNEVRGQAAYLGLVQGKVKVVLDPKDFQTKDKFVLVTTMTTPSFVQFLKHVVAIVTDEGGLTCHAAIISREFKIPCVIGTKFATKVFKDGDLVEVDANKGIVRKLIVDR